LNVVYVDAAHHIALLVPNDRLHDAAVRVNARLKSLRYQYVTSDPVLVETLAHISGAGSWLRTSAVAFIEALHRRGDIEIVPQTRALFDAGLDLFRQRPDKGYSLTDCMSMSICRERGINEVLTHDAHFAQEGFAVLL
jgi:predicted nucleic acid-binding protein